MTTFYCKECDWRISNVGGMKPECPICRASLWMTDDRPTPDEKLGDYVYCGSHARAHATGWCTVPIYDKTPLEADNIEDAIKEAKEKGLKQ